MIASAWNPKQLDEMALPPCHVLFHVDVIGDKLNLGWFQRSVVIFIGLPFNIASYGTLLHLLSKESGIEPGHLVGHLGDVHIYENHLEAVEEQLSKGPKDLPRIETKSFSSIFNWTYDQTKFLNYDPHPTIKAEVAV